jgi:chemotaxis protein MotB
MSRKKQAAAPNHERWLVSYADFITMMFALFVVLYSTSQSDHQRKSELAAAIQAAFRQLELFPPSTKTPDLEPPGASIGAAVVPDSGYEAMKSGTKPPQLMPKDLLDLKRQLETRLAREIGQQAVAVTITRDGLVISLREVGFFESGSAIPRANAAGSLRAIAATLQTASNKLRIEGHTDDIPIRNERYPSNWDLSAARASSIARTLIEQYDFLPERISVAGYAQYHPIVSNTSDAGRALNRRVDLVVLPGSR